MNATKGFLSLRRMFYLVAPSESMYDSLDSMPNYVTDALPFFLIMIVLEFAIVSRKRSKYTGIDVSDGISSITAGILSRIPGLFMRSVEVVSYIWVYDHYHLVRLSPRSTSVWIVGMLGVDFSYYWIHRASHEISLFWSGHQAHHSSQRYNLTTALRQGTLQTYFSWMFYLPMAFFLPPTIFVAHFQFNLVFQFWIHTEVVGKLGVLEYFLNTPSHHRVHHGRNRYCIDKNYGGTLIIFDRIFGTFEAEDDKVVYGVVHPIQTWDPLHVQICHLRYVAQQFWTVKGAVNKLRVLFYGPGWAPGTSRLGDPSQIPDPESPVLFYQQKLSNSTIAYCAGNFVLCLIVYWSLALYGRQMSTEALISVAGLLVITLVQLGRILDNVNVFWSECLRNVTIAIVLSRLVT